MSGPMEITEVAWQRAPQGSPTGYYNSFNLYLAAASGSELTDTYEDNYVAGTRVLVYSTTQLVMSANPDEWSAITLDTPYWYDGTGNLILEFDWVGGSNMFFTYMWDTGSNRGLMNTSDVHSPTGILQANVSELRFDGPLALVPATFAEIKTLGTP